MNISLNDWGLKKFFTFVFSIQVGMLGSLGCGAIGFQLPIIRQLIGFIYLMFIPGILILRILKIHKIGVIETYLLTVGLSISVIMFLGAAINYSSIIFGFTNPISLWNLIFFFTLIISILCIFCYFTDSEFQCDDSKNYYHSLSVSSLFLLTIPIISVLGAHFINLYNNPIVIYLMIILISIIVLFIGSDRFISNQLYPSAIYFISISLLFHQSLITEYLIGWDIQQEYYLSNLVLKNFFWDSTLSYNVNSMLSIVIFEPIISLIFGLDSIWIFKIVYPSIFALVPLGLYYIFKNFVSEKISFFACFFFVSITTFYLEMIALARQQIAELFLVLILLLITIEKISKLKKSILLIIFSFSLVVSHYGLSYVYLLSIIYTIIIYSLLNSKNILYFINYIEKKRALKTYTSFEYLSTFFNRENKTITFNYLLSFLVFLFSWYIFNTNSSTFNSVVYHFERVFGNFFEDFLNPESIQGLNMVLTKTDSIISHISKLINFSNQIFIIIGFFSAIFYQKKLNMNFKNEYLIISSGYLCMLFASVSVPFFASALNMSRLYHISIIFLSIFCIIGISLFFNKVISLLLNKLNIAFTGKQITKIHLFATSVYLVIFFLYQVGLVHQIFLGQSLSIALNDELDYPYFNQMETVGAEWLSTEKNESRSIYADAHRYLLLKSIDWESTTSLDSVDTLFLNEIRPYLYLGTFNILKNDFLVRSREYYINSENLTINFSKIYDSGGSNIYLYL